MAYFSIREINIQSVNSNVGNENSVEEAEERLMHLREQGESSYAFSFKHKGDKALEEKV
ncbi:DUF3291 domain-containing protein [Shewanella benthica]|nr:DUF3291 domain-containing protein [Shewanella benthica]